MVLAVIHTSIDADILLNILGSKSLFYADDNRNDSAVYRNMELRGRFDKKGHNFPKTYNDLIFLNCNLYYVT